MVPHAGGAHLLVVDNATKGEETIVRVFELVVDFRVGETHEGEAPGRNLDP